MRSTRLCQTDTPKRDRSWVIRNQTATTGGTWPGGLNRWIAVVQIEPNGWTMSVAQLIAMSENIRAKGKEIRNCYRNSIVVFASTRLCPKRDLLEATYRIWSTLEQSCPSKNK